uniref:Uncharacterized protein n=1 Tax=Knipowitschia caucasica TaxID=637954 RepID=A0AAV2MMU7_KNICA
MDVAQQKGDLSKREEPGREKKRNNPGEMSCLRSSCPTSPKGTSAHPRLAFSDEEEEEVDYKGWCPVSADASLAHGLLSLGQITPLLSYIHLGGIGVGFLFLFRVRGREVGR